MVPNARELVAGLVGTTIHTLDRDEPNIVLRIEGANVVVGTANSPEGAPVALRKIQDGLDILFSTNEIRIATSTFGGYRRSSFIGAVLGTLEGVAVTPRPVWVRLNVEAGNHAPDGVTRGYPDPEMAAAIDKVGVLVALQAIEDRFAGFEIEEMRHTNPGFDVRVLDADGVALAYIEIKSTSTGLPVFFLSETERQFAQRYADRYHLAVVTSVDVASKSGEVHWREGALTGADIYLQPRHWKGALLTNKEA
ncbi:MAG TPA: DUF3883 domain-containing protein [Solirubrobacteraceae bacterium]|jgi:hypothetical protein|nr:DUF3883 domain-containing protein [Solirubrobacteraceae bacterium]